MHWFGVVGRGGWEGQVGEVLGIWAELVCMETGVPSRKGKGSIGLHWGDWWVHWLGVVRRGERVSGRER